jgi:hypothetical protein
MDNCNTATIQAGERILARRLARELTKEELLAITGGLVKSGGNAVAPAAKFVANSCSANTCTVCCDTDGGADD